MRHGPAAPPRSSDRQFSGVVALPLDGPAAAAPVNPVNDFGPGDGFWANNPGWADESATPAPQPQSWAQPATPEPTAAPGPAPAWSQPAAPEQPWSTEDDWTGAQPWADGGAWQSDYQPEPDYYRDEEFDSQEFEAQDFDSREFQATDYADYHGSCDLESAGYGQTQYPPSGEFERLGDVQPEPLTAPSEIIPQRSGGHRANKPASGKGRAAVFAMAAGAVVAAGQSALADPGDATPAKQEAAGQAHGTNQGKAIANAASSSSSPQILQAAASQGDHSQFNDLLQNGQRYAQKMAKAEQAKMRPLFAKFANGNFTSGFGARWGVQHLGVDIAGPIGTPIYAVADGTVIDAGPASGFGMWVRLKHADGTITVYGHVNTTTVSVGQRVMAGDQIATIGNRGFSTGPHCHFEVWQNGSTKIDPKPWLASRGISLGPQRD